MIWQIPRVCIYSSRNLLKNNTFSTLRSTTWNQIRPGHTVGARNVNSTKTFGRYLLLSGAFVSAKDLGTQLVQDVQLPELKKIEQIDYETLSDPIKSTIEEGTFTWKKFWELLKPHIIYLLCSVVSSLAVAFFNIKIPGILGEISNLVSDAAALTDNTYAAFIENVSKPAIRLLGCYALQSVCTLVSIACLSNLAEVLAADLRMRLFSNLLNQDAEFFDRHRSTELLSHITHDVHEFKSSFRSFISQGVRSCSQVLGCAVSLYITSPELAFGLMLTIPTLVAIGSLFGSVLRQLSRKCQQQQAKCGAAAGDTLSHVRTVKLFAMEQAERDRYKALSDYLACLHKKLGLGVGVFQALSHLTLNALVGCTLFFGGILVAEHSLQPGQLLSFLVAAQMAQRSLAALSLSFGQFVRCTAAAGRIFACLELKPVLEGDSGSVHIQPPIGDVTFNNIHFAYPTRSSQHVLCDLNLQIPAGKVTAVCGPSGAGKSTLALLLARVYDVNVGQVRIGKHNVCDLDLRWLRGHAIGFISQEPALFATSILENIRYARPDATDREVQAAARAAHAHEFISQLPGGYSTMVGERGLSLSGGQRQRIAIARAILKDPAILILDEATSALDSDSERLVNESLDRLMQGRTVLVIAHRLSTIKNADQIAVMNEGQIVEKGTHEQLLKQRGFYWNLWRQQFHEKHYIG